MSHILWRDIYHAMRRLVRDWPFTAAAIAILALGIGANTAIFSLVNAALFRPLPFRDPDRLVNVYQNVGEDRLPLATSYPAYRDIAAHTEVFSGVAAVVPYNVQYQGTDGIHPAVVEFATSNYLAVLGLTPAAGRWLDPGEDQPGAEPAAVLGYRAWTSRFGADPAVIGSTLLIEGVPVTVVGIAPESHRSTINAGIVTDFWLSISSLAAVGNETMGPLLAQRQGTMFLLKARLRQGVTPDRAQAAMDVLGAQLAADFPGEDPGQGISVLTDDQVRVHPRADALLVPAATILLAVVGLVLAIACSNLATLLLVRGASRTKEVSVRLALGASRPQLIRHLLTESVLLALAGAGAGYVLAGWGIRWLSTLNLPITMDFSLDQRVLAYTIALSLITGITFGLAPALKSTRIDLVSSLRDEGGALSLGRRWFSLKNGLLVFQVAMSCLLLAGTAMGLRAVAVTQANDPRFAVQGVAFLSATAQFAGYTPQRTEALYAEFLERVRAIPGVEAAALASAPPGNGDRSDPLLIDDYEPPPGSDVVAASVLAGPGYFETLRIPLLYGRRFDARDRSDAPATAIVNETMARRYFGTINAVGRRFALARTPGTPIEISGVVPDTLTTGLNERPAPLFYRPIAQVPVPAATVLARTSRDAGGLAGAMLRDFRSIDRDLPVTEVATLAQHLKDSLRPVRVVFAALGGLGLLGLVLASIGLYAVVAYAVAHRSVEVGIRMALGARTHQVVWLIARDVAALIGVGIALGIGLSWAATRLLQGTGSVAPAVNIDSIDAPTADPLTLAAVALLIAAAGLLAAFLPARRAAYADPLAALRHH